MSRASGGECGAAQRDQVVLITGCSTGGIGWHLAAALAGRSARVYASARRLSSMAGLAERGCRLLAIDVTQPATIRAAVDAIIADAGCIDGGMGQRVGGSPDRFGTRDQCKPLAPAKRRAAPERPSAP